MDSSQNTEKSTSSPELTQLWRGLSHNQRRFAVAMLECPTKKDAALSVGVTPDAVYRWPETVDRVIELLMEDAAQSAYGILEQSVVKAAAIKRAGLDSDDERVRQGVSTEILDRVLGKAMQRQEITGAVEFDIEAWRRKQEERRQQWAELQKPECASEDE